MLDETRAQLLQDVYYISNKNPIILGLLQREVEVITHILFNIHANKVHYWRDFGDDAWEASTRFIEMYLKHSEWMCKSFRNRLYLEVKYQLYNDKKKKQDFYLSDEEVSETIQNLPKPETEDYLWVLEDLKFDKPEYYKKIMFDCYTSRTYKQFILKLSEYTSKRWIYDYSIRLNKLYKYTRRRR
jgi:hypothetical protein